jgi:transcriptional regulator with XRE-family HTH domain
MEKTTHRRAYRRLLTVLRAARERAGLTQAEVATRLDVYASFVSKVESGERRLDVVELAEFCGVYGTDLVALLKEAGVVG